MALSKHPKHQDLVFVGAWKYDKGFYGYVIDRTENYWLIEDITERKLTSRWPPRFCTPAVWTFHGPVRREADLPG